MRDGGRIEEAAWQGAVVLNNLSESRNHGMMQSVGINGKQIIPLYFIGLMKKGTIKPQYRVTEEDETESGGETETESESF